VCPEKGRLFVSVIGSVKIITHTSDPYENRESHFCQSIEIYDIDETKGSFLSATILHPCPEWARAYTEIFFGSRTAVIA